MYKLTVTPHLTLQKISGFDEAKVASTLKEGKKEKTKMKYKIKKKMKIRIKLKIKKIKELKIGKHEKILK
jgi:hypothetical protein